MSQDFLDELDDALAALERRCVETLAMLTARRGVELGRPPDPALEPERPMVGLVELDVPPAAVEREYGAGAQRADPWAMECLKDLGRALDSAAAGPYPTAAATSGGPGDVA